MELIKIEQINIGNELKQTVNARELHKVLQSKQDFSTWIKKRIEDYGFQENIDYLKLHKKMELSTTGQTVIEYHLTIDMSKELSMLEKNEFGKQARLYFIEQEKIAQAPKQPASLLDWIEICREVELKRIALEAQVKQMEPAQKYVEELVEVGQLWSLAEVGKKLGIGQNKLFSKLRGMEILISTGVQYNLPYQRYVDQGYFIVKEKKTSRPDRPYYSQTFVTAKGVAWLHKVITGQLVIKPALT